jgi:hypothetical protein
MRGQARLSRRTYRKRRQVALAEAAAATAPGATPDALPDLTLGAFFRGEPRQLFSALALRKAQPSTDEPSALYPMFRGLDRCVPNVKVEPLALLAKPMNGINAPQRPDCMAGHVRFELRNVVANYPFEKSRRFAGIGRIPAMETTRV